MVIDDPRIVISEHRTPNGEALTLDADLKRQTSVHLYVGFLAQTSQPAFLLGLGFFRDQFFLNLVPDFGEGACHAAAFSFDFENVIVAGQSDDVANLSGSQIKRDFLERRL